MRIARLAASINHRLTNCVHTHERQSEMVEGNNFTTKQHNAFSEKDAWPLASLNYANNEATAIRYMFKNNETQQNNYDVYLHEEQSTNNRLKRTCP